MVKEVLEFMPLYFRLILYTEYKFIKMKQMWWYLNNLLYSFFINLSFIILSPIQSSSYSFPLTYSGCQWTPEPSSSFLILLNCGIDLDKPQFEFNFIGLKILILDRKLKYIYNLLFYMKFSFIFLLFCSFVVLYF